MCSSAARLPETRLLPDAVGVCHERWASASLVILGTNSLGVSSKMVWCDNEERDQSPQTPRPPRSSPCTTRHPAHRRYVELRLVPTGRRRRRPHKRLRAMRMKHCAPARRAAPDLLTRRPRVSPPPVADSLRTIGARRQPATGAIESGSHPPPREVDRCRRIVRRQAARMPDRSQVGTITLTTGGWCRLVAGPSLRLNLSTRIGCRRHRWSGPGRRHRAVLAP